MSNEFEIEDDWLTIQVSNRRYKFHVPGLSDMASRKRKRNRALTLIAMIILEIEFFNGETGTPTQDAILKKIIALGGTLSPTSISMVNRNIYHLIDDNHVLLREDHKRPDRGRGGPAWPWYTRYTGRAVKESMRQSSI